MNGIKELAAKIRNVFCVSDFQKRDGEGITQVKTRNGHVLEGAEAFPYGFIAKAKSGKAFVLCQGGNLDGFTILPVLISPDVTPPELEEGDTALFTGEGGRIVLRENGDVEIDNAAGDLWIALKSGGAVEVKGTDITVKGENVTIDGGKVDIKGAVKVSGGSLECAGTVSPTGSGPFCALLNCAFTGAPHVGNKAGST